VSRQAPSSYSKLDRALHKLAFNSKLLQNVLADMERSMFSQRWQDISADKPVFVTSLPRAGTTIILQTLNRMCHLATYTYRDMPFILTPLIWDKVSRVFSRTSKPAERAHGDGLVIDEDSPEAFEEVLWKKYFPGYYDQTGINCWQDSLHRPVFEQAFRGHMQKLLMLRYADSSSSLRYISKNNANIARIGYLQELFPDARFVVPLRHPVEQAISLLRQHQNFICLHANDTFARRYMADIGHFEFGELHRAIRFPDLAGLVRGLGPGSLDYWLAYWLAAFRELSRYPNLCFISFEDLCIHPETSLQNLLNYLELDAEKASVKQAALTFRPPLERRGEYSVDPVLVEQAMACYKGLQGEFLSSGETAP